MRWLSQIYAGGTPDRSNLEYWSNGTIPWLNSGSVNDWEVRSPSALITPAGYASSSARWVPAKSVVIALAGQGKTKGMVARTEIRATTNQSMAAIVPGNQLEYRFLQYWLTSNYQSIRNLAGGDLRDGLNLQHIASIECPLPPMDEQRRIADFLDAATAQIDELIAEQERFIALLRERRRSVVDHVLLDHGVDLSDLEAPMVPTGWRVVLLSQVLRELTNGYVGPTRDILVEDGVRYIQGMHIKAGRIDFERRPFFVRRDWHAARPRIHLREGDVLIVQTGDIGNVAVVPSDFGEASCHALLIARARLDTITGEYLGAYLSSCYGYGQLIKRATGALHPHLERGIRSTPVVVPPLTTQAGVVAAVVDQNEKIDSMIGEMGRNIALSKERRASLITAAVTGQIDVSTGRAA